MRQLPPPPNGNSGIAHGYFPLKEYGVKSIFQKKGYYFMFDPRCCNKVLWVIFVQIPLLSGCGLILSGMATP